MRRSRRAAGTTTSRAPTRPGSMVPPDAVFGRLGCNGGPRGPDEPDRRRARRSGPRCSGCSARSSATTLLAEVPALPPSVFFTLGPAPPGERTLQRAPGRGAAGARGRRRRACRVGGVRLPRRRAPARAGRSRSRSSPCGTSSIDDVCGNFGGWQPFAADELRARYGTSDDVRDARYAQAYDALVADGFALTSEGRACGRRRPRARSTPRSACRADPVAHPLEAVGLLHLGLPSRRAARRPGRGRGSRRGCRPSPARWAGRGRGCRRSGP